MNFFKKFFLRAISIEIDYPLKGDASAIAKKIAAKVTPQEKKFKLFFLSPPMFDTEALRERANEIASETSQFLGRAVSYKGGKMIGSEIFLNYKISS